VNLWVLTQDEITDPPIRSKV